MAFRSINPFDGSLAGEFPTWGANELDLALGQVAKVTPAWAATPLRERCACLRRAAEVLRVKREDYARLITLEMGKLIGEARAEVEKCALVCDFYADRAEHFLADEIIASDASRSLVAHQPLGTVLAVMPWNFPFWQVFRFAAPGLAAGNTGVLKHASNVPQCAMAIEHVFREADFPEQVFRTLMISAPQVKGVIEDARVHAVTLTGSEAAGRQVAATAAGSLKKSVLELGGSDAFVVLEDADLEEAAKVGVSARFLNAGQSCIASKRFIVVDQVYDDFLARFKSGVEALMPGDPMNADTTLAPMSRHDLRDELHMQVLDSISAGARAITGCASEDHAGAFYQASIVAEVVPGQRAYTEELFGPVAIVIRARDEADALRIANDSRFGLGGCVWSTDTERGEAFARKVQSGAVFVNGMVKSDPRLPFGGVKASGYGRELSHHGMHEFINAKTLWIK